jgi:hypothetical protein
MNIVFLPTLIGSSVYNLSQSLNSDLIHSEVVIFRKFGNYNKFSSNRFDKAIEFRNSFEAIIKIFLFYLKAIFTYDIFFFTGGMSLAYSDKYRILNHLDLLFLKILNKKIIMLYQGTSGRLASYSINNYEITHYKLPEFQDDYKKDRIKEYRFSLVNSSADIIFAYNPDLLNNLPSKALFLPYTSVSYSNFIFNPSINKRLLVAHAPTNRRVKGTSIVLNVIEKLRAKNDCFDFILIENKDYSEMDELLSKVDILIDQLFVGWYGGIAVETMAKGGVVISYIRENDYVHIPKQMAIDNPIWNANKETLEGILEFLILNTEVLIESKQKSYDYVIKWHNPEIISKTLTKRIFEL